MSVVVVEPAEDVLTLGEIKAHCRAEGFDDDDVLLGSLARAAERHLAGPDGWLGRSIGRQTLELRLDAFLYDHGLRLPYGPTSSVVSVAYEDPADAPQTLPPSDYTLVDAGSISASLALAPGKSWPATACRRSAVRIRYVAGYAPADVPPPLKQAMLLLVGHWYATREAVNIGNIVSTIPMTVEALTAPYRLWG